MSSAELERYLHEHIPLSRAMQVAVRQVQDDGVVLAAPLAPNINHRETVFGGSASAVATLAAWALLHARLRGAGIAARLVIQRNSMEYTRPIAGDFIARSFLPEPHRWETFMHMLQRRGRGRIVAAARLEYGGCEAGRFSGEFVALIGEAPPSGD